MSHSLSHITRRRLLQAALISGSGLLIPPLLAASRRPAQVREVRLWTAPDHTRIVFDLDQEAEHTLFRLGNPERMVLDLLNTGMATTLEGLPLPDPVVKRVRVGRREGNTTRAVFDLAAEVRPRSFLLKAADGKPPRLVVDLYRADAAAETTPPTPPRHQRKESVVVIDPGHGGEDPGAVGHLGTREKDIALAVARKLEAQINREPGMKAHLTRNGDYYVPLVKRVSIARHHEPDLFISLHADAFRNKDARGASVYALSERGKPSPDKAINDLVRRENNADLIGGVDLEKVADREVAGILMDLAQRDAINRGLALGERIIDSLDDVTRLKFHSVKQAGFAVLKAPDMPSVLVEMAFLTNPHEEKLLRQDAHQRKLAEALFAGAREFAKISRQG